MLGKQGWKFISQPNAMVTRFFKAKYFPRHEFLEANRGSNPSYIWHSIWSSKLLLAEGHRWAIGDGSRIHIWYFAWLRGGQLKLTGAPPNAFVQQVTVHDLMTHGTKEWVPYIIHDFFTVDHAEQILSTPLLDSNTHDRCIWSLSVLGDYTVRTAYHLYMSTFADAHSLQVEDLWSVIWKLPVPQKIKVFSGRFVDRVYPLESACAIRVSIAQHCVSFVQGS